MIGGGLAALAALALHALMDRAWPGSARFALIFPTILLSCLVLGRLGGASALFTGLMGIWLLIMPSRGDLSAMKVAEAVSLLTYLASGALVIVVTEGYRAISRQLLQERDAAAARKAAEDARFADLFRNAPGLVGIYRGQNLVVEFASRSLLACLDRGEMIGRSFQDMAPETDPAVLALMRRVLEDGVTFEGKQVSSPLQRAGGVLEERYFDLLFRRIEPSPTGEARLLVQAVDVTEEVLRRQESERANQQIKAVLEEMPVGVALLSPQTHEVVLYNRAAVEILGHESLGGLPSDYGAYGAIHADGRPYEPQEYPAARALQNGEVIVREAMLYLRPDGERVRLTVDCKRVADVTGRPLVVCTFTDVTALHRALDGKTLLINELNHRVKNTLATVQSLASRAFSQDLPPAAAREAFEGRLHALSQAHNVLTSADWRAASLLALIEGAIAPFGSERFTIRGKDVDLRPEKALAIAMALHELATNAVKYGALSAEAGSIDIHCDDHAGARRLTWREHGGPPVVAPATTGFGARLLRRALAQEVGGEIRLEFAREGVVCRIEGL
ncbi:PAS domain-containing protein [Caulobacter sp. 602-2]|uniref:histidine kinase n=1 Tax=Caulobacter sp. 602-2 TaxID=2710887 RepID=A0A6G4QVE7_9CAUL|nr:PAS domain-containing protein [Caulobacter sp. 602-2]